MMKAAAFFLSSLLVAAPTQAGAWLIQAPAQVCPPIGLGDLGLTYTFYWSVRAYTTAYATAAGKSMNVIRASDSVTCDFVYDGSGDLRALTTTSCSNAGASDGQLPSTFCSGTTCKPTKIYNQTGGTACSGSTACDYAQSTDANRFTLDLSCGEVPFCVNMANGQSMATPSYSPPSATQTLGVVAQRLTGAGGSLILIQDSTGNPNFISPSASAASVWTASINGLTLSSGSVAPNAVFHAAVLAMQSGTNNTSLTVDTTVATITRTASANAAAFSMSGNVNGGYWLESSYIASSAQSSTDRTTAISNQRTCWNF